MSGCWSCTWGLAPGHRDNHATSLRKRALTEPSALSAINHVRAQCRGRHIGARWSDAGHGQGPAEGEAQQGDGMQFMIGGELDEADRARAAARLLRETIENERTR